MLNLIESDSITTDDFVNDCIMPQALICIKQYNNVNNSAEALAFANMSCQVIHMQLLALQCLTVFTFCNKSKIEIQVTIPVKHWFNWKLELHM